MLNELHYLTYGLERIPYELQPRRGNIYRVLIKIHADCRVIVKVPPSASEEEIHYAVKKRARWIYQKHNQFKKQLEHITPRHYISGESHFYLGKKYLLKVSDGSDTQSEVKFFQGKLEIKIGNRKNIKSLLIDWYKEKARIIFKQRLENILPQVLWMIECPQIHLLTMQTQWGSCSSGGRLTLNPHLVKASPECIDYVILHELCHLAEHNHSERFYRLMKQVMPNWEIVKNKLDNMASSFLN